MQPTFSGMISLAPGLGNNLVHGNTGSDFQQLSALGSDLDDSQLGNDVVDAVIAGEGMLVFSTILGLPFLSQ